MTLVEMVAQALLDEDLRDRGLASAALLDVQNFQHYIARARVAVLVCQRHVERKFKLFINEEMA